jgi:hypothetical protein
VDIPLDWSSFPLFDKAIKKGKGKQAESCTESHVAAVPELSPGSVSFGENATLKRLPLF